MLNVIFSLLLVVRWFQMHSQMDDSMFDKLSGHQRQPMEFVRSKQLWSGNLQRNYRVQSGNEIWPMKQQQQRYAIDDEFMTPASIGQVSLWLGGCRYSIKKDIIMMLMRRMALRLKGEFYWCIIAWNVCPHWMEIGPKGIFSRTHHSSARGFRRPSSDYMVMLSLWWYD